MFQTTPFIRRFVASLTLLLMLNSAAFSQTFTWNDSTGNFSDTLRWTGGVVPIRSDILTTLNFGGSTTYTATNDLSPAFYLNNLNFSSTANSTVTGSSQLRFTSTGTAGITKTGTGTSTVTAPMRIASAFSVDVAAGSGQLTLGNTSTEPIFRGNGTINISNLSSNPVLMGGLTYNTVPNKVFTGTINVTAGTVKLLATQANFSSRSVNVSLATGTTYDFSGYGGFNGLGGLSGSGSVILGPPASGSSFVLYDTTNRTFSGTISGDSGQINTFGTGTWSFAGSINTTGSILVSGGKLRLVDSGTMNTLTSSNGSNYTVDHGGTLTLDNTGTVNLNNRLASTLSFVNLRLGTGTFEFIGRASTASSQIIEFSSSGQGALHANGGVAKVVLTAGSGGTAALTFGTTGSAQNAITRNNGGTLILPALTASTTITLRDGLNDLQSGIIGGFVTVGNDWATVNASSQVLAYSAYQTGTTADSWVAANNVKINAAVTTRTTSGAINSLNFTAAQPVTLNSSVLLTLNSGGILASANGSITGGTITAGNSERDLIAIINSGASVDLSGTAIVNNPNPGNGITLTKSGGGTLTLGNSNTYTGTTYLNEGTLVITGANSIRPDTPMWLRGGATLKVQSVSNVVMNNLTINLREGKIDTNGVNLTVGYMNDGGNFNKSLTKLGAGTLIIAGQPYFQTYGDRVDIQQGSIRFTNVKGFDQAAVTIASGATFDDSYFDSVNSTDKRVGSLSGAGNYIARGSAYVRIGANGNDTTFSGVVSAAFNGTPTTTATHLYKEGQGSLGLSGPNTYTGFTIVYGGTLIALAPVALNTPGPVGSASSAVYVWPSGTVDASLLMGDASTFARPIIAETGGTGIITIGGSASGTAVFTGTVTLNRTPELTSQLTTEFRGIISGANGVISVGPGTVQFTANNTYQGATQVVMGNLELSGAGSVGNSPYVEVGSNGSFWLTNLNTAFAKPLRLQGNTNSFGVLNNNAGTNTVSGTINLLSAAGIGVTAGNLTISGVVSGPGTLAKRGPGLLTLSAANDYTGGTSLLQGNLRFSTLNNLGTGGISLNGGTLQYAIGNTVDISTRAVTFTGLAGIDTNGNNVTYANSVGGGGVGILTKSGTGTLTLQAANSYSGGTVLNSGWLTGRAQASGSPFGSGPITIGTGRLTLSGIAANTSTTQTGALTISGGAEIYVPKVGSNTNSLTFSSLARSGRGTLVTYDFSALNFLYFTSPPANTNLIVAPWAVTESGYFLQYTATWGLSYGGVAYQSNVNTMPTTGVLALTSTTQTLTNNRTAYAIQLNSYTINGAFTLTVGNGSGQAGMTFDGGTFSASGLAFGAAEATIYTSASNGTISSGTTITGSNGLTKFGPGTLNINGTLNMSGPITVNGGVLKINGSVSGGGTMTVGNGQTLGGGGTIAVPVTIGVGGRIAPGNSPGTLNLTSAVTLNTGSTFEVELGGTGAGQSDLINLGSTGSINLGGATLSVTLVNGYIPQPTDSITIVTGTGTNAVTGQFDSIGNGGTVLVGATPTFEYFAIVNYDSSSITLNGFTAVPVPEPVYILALAGMVVAVRRYRKRQVPVS